MNETPEQRHCPKCGQVIMEPAGPIARDIGLTHCERRVFIIDGKPGLWACKSDWGEGETEKVDAVFADDEVKRGRGKRKTLYRLNRLIADVEAMLKDWRATE